MLAAAAAWDGLAADLHLRRPPISRWSRTWPAQHGWVPR